jgi:hypothetical protein
LLLVVDGLVEIRGVLTYYPHPHPHATHATYTPKHPTHRKPREAGGGGDEGPGGSGGGHYTTGGPSGGGGGARAEASAAPVLYRFDRIEAQIRLLADTCLVMQDYETALSSYKLVRVRVWCVQWWW